MVFGPGRWLSESKSCALVRLGPLCWSVFDGSQIEKQDYTPFSLLVFECDLEGWLTCQVLAGCL